MNWETEALERAAKFQTVANDVKKAVEGAKKIRADVDGLNGSVEDLGKIQLEHVDAEQALRGLSGAASKIVEFLLNDVPHISPVMKGWLEEITGKPSAIEDSAKHWEAYKTQLSPFAAGMKEPAKKMQDVWTGRVANGVCAVLVAEDVIIDALGEGFDLCGKTIRFVGHLLGKLREMIIKLITDLLAKILEKIGTTLLASALPFSAPVQLLANIYSISTAAWDYYEQYKKIRDNYKKLVSDIEKEWSNLQAAFHGAKQLVA